MKAANGGVSGEIQWWAGDGALCVNSASYQHQRMA